MLVKNKKGKFWVNDDRRRRRRRRRRWKILRSRAAPPAAGSQKAFHIDLNCSLQNTVNRNFQACAASTYRFLWGCCYCVPFSQKFFLNHLTSLQGHSKLSASHFKVYASHGLVMCKSRASLEQVMHKSCTRHLQVMCK